LCGGRPTTSRDVCAVWGQSIDALFDVKRDWGHVLPGVRGGAGEERGVTCRAGAPGAVAEGERVMLPEGTNEEARTAGCGVHKVS